MNDIQCVPMSYTHIEHVYEISCLSFQAPWSKESVFDELVNPMARYIIAVKEDKVIGFGGMWVILDEAHITNIAVHPEYRQCGIGIKIITELTKLCENEKITAMTLEVRKSNIKAQKLYEKFDFKVEGIRKGYYQDNKEDCLIMWKKF